MKARRKQCTKDIAYIIKGITKYLTWPLGIRLQLMLWYTGVFALLLILAGIVLYKHLEISLNESMDGTLHIRAQQIANGISVDQYGNLHLDQATANLPGFQDRTNAPRIGHINDDIMVGLLDAHGKILHTTPAFRTLHIPQQSITDPLHGMHWEGTIATNKDEEEVRLYSANITRNGKTIVIIQVGQYTGALKDTLHHVSEELLLIGIFVILGGALGSYWLAARAFQPIHHLILTARSIKGGDLHQRVPVPAAHDELRYLAITLNEMIESLDRVLTLQRRFVSDASHELRTPVAVIRNMTDIALLQASSPQEYETVLRNVNAEAERLGHLISDLLALARGDEGRAHFEIETLRLDQIAEAVLENAETLAQERQVTLHSNLAEPVTMQGDETRLIQVIMNLLDNAILYNKAGGSVTMSVKNAGPDVLLIVQDTGIGIAEKDIPHIFERFYRVDQARTRREGGSSGLGLAIVEWIVKVHQGTIQVESQPGEGSTFIVRLPAQRSTNS